MRLLNAFSITACAVMFISGLFNAFQAMNVTSMLDTLPDDATVREISILKERMSRAEETIQSLKAAIDDEDKNETFCMPWETNMDYWWTHHPDWYVSMENNTHYCFSPIEDPEKASVMRALYKIQFPRHCTNITTKEMMNHGYGADMQHVVDALKYAYDTGIPCQMYSKAWHYAAKKDASRPVCPKMDMFCYFLDIGGCDPNPNSLTVGKLPGKWISGKGKPNFETDGFDRWSLEYATRPQTWLRREVYFFSKKVNIVTPCSTVHVRRSDIVLNGAASRKYRPVDDYVNALSNETKNILLLTDDANAIGEAKVKFPDYNWMYIDRPRHKGAEGGYENQIPSDDPKLEVIAILSTFKLASQCSELIYTYGNFARMIKGASATARKNDAFRAVDLDKGPKNRGPLFSKENKYSVNISMSYNL